MFHGKPIVGIAGGIGSGKSFVARLLGEMACKIISADDLVKLAYNQEPVRETVRQWWGEAVFKPDGSVNRGAIAQKIFVDPAERRRLENLLHPLVAAMRRQVMQESAGDPQVVAFVWDTPLLFESGANDQCDAVIFVDAPPDLRKDRVARDRGWDEQELARRENLQWPLDRKRKISDYIIQSTADSGVARSQVRDVLSRILARASHRSAPA